MKRNLSILASLLLLASLASAAAPWSATSAARQSHHAWAGKEFKRPMMRHAAPAFLAAPKNAGGPDSANYRYIDSREAGGPAFQWQDITGTGTALNGLFSDNDDGYYYGIPFTFTFYGNTYTTLSVASNGPVYFEDNYMGNGYTNIPGNNSYNVNQYIAPYWCDLYPGAHGDVYYQVIGDTLVVEFYQVPLYGTSDYQTFEVILVNRTGSNGDIYFEYLDLANLGSYAAGGIQGSNVNPPLLGLEYFFQSNVLADSLAVKFSSYVPTAHDVTIAGINSPLTVSAPAVAVTPTATIFNPGLNPESDFKVFFQINDSLGAQLYLDSAQITSPDSILPDSLRQFTFDGFTPAAYTRYTAVAWTSLADDYPWNDTLRKPFRTWDLDIAASAIVAPAGMVLPDPDIVPRVTFHNAGTQIADFDATLRADYGGSPMYQGQLSVTGLAGGADTTVEFPVWPGVRLTGTYNVTAYATMAHDISGANDTVTGTFLSGSNVWVSKTPLNISQEYCHTVAPWHGRVYLFGGAPLATFCNTIKYYDTLTGAWDTVATVLPTNLLAASAVTVGDRILLFGGCETWPNPLGAVYCYWPAGDSLTTLSSMPTATMEAAAGIWRDSLIYIVGGGNWGMPPIRTVQVYDIAGNSWATGTGLPAAVGTLGGGVLGDTIVTVGGYNGSYTDASYIGVIDPANPDSISWSTGTAYPAGAAGRPSSAVKGHTLYVSAGYSGSDLLAATYSYTAAGGWNRLADKTTATIGAGQAAIVGDWLYVIAGENTGNNEALYIGASATDQPVITATDPVSGASDVPVSAPLVITFSKPMDSATVAFSCLPDPGNLAAAWNYNHTVMTVSHDSFAGTTGHTVTVTAGQSMDGFALASGAVPNPFMFTTGVNGVAGRPVTAGVAFFLAAAYPNPVSRGNAIFSFGLPKASDATLEIYNIMGQKVATVVSGKLAAGVHTVRWSGRDNAGRAVASGVFVYRLTSGSGTATRKLVIVR